MQIANTKETRNLNVGDRVWAVVTTNGRIGHGKVVRRVAVYEYQPRTETGFVFVRYETGDLMPNKRTNELLASRYPYAIDGRPTKEKARIDFLLEEDLDERDYFEMQFIERDLNGSAVWAYKHGNGWSFYVQTRHGEKFLAHYKGHFAVALSKYQAANKL